MMCYYLNVHFQGQRVKEDIVNNIFAMFALPNIPSYSRYSQHHLRISKMNQYGWIKSGYLSTCKFIHNNICIVVSLKGDFNFVIPWHLLKALNKSTNAPSQYSISAPQWKQTQAVSNKKGQSWLDWKCDFEYGIYKPRLSAYVISYIIFRRQA